MVIITIILLTVYTIIYVTLFMKYLTFIYLLDIDIILNLFNLFKFF